MFSIFCRNSHKLFFDGLCGLTKNLDTTATYEYNKTYVNFNRNYNHFTFLRGRVNNLERSMEQ